MGILGGTGSSKSSLVQLIPRLYDVSEGRLLVGDKDVRDYDLVALRDSVSMVLQKNVLFSGTIKENIRWGNAAASDEEIKRVCRLACADEFIESFPDGYDTHIEQGGTNVSGGQKQRLCIARALIKNRKSLFLTTVRRQSIQRPTRLSGKRSGKKSPTRPKSSSLSAWLPLRTQTKSS